MKIAFIGQKGYPAHSGGIERHVEFLVKWLRIYNHQVYLYARRWYNEENGAPAEINDKGINIIYKGSIKTKNLDTISHVFLATWHAMRQDYDVIHFQGIGPTLLAWIAQIYRFIFRKKYKIIATFHSIDRYHQKWGIFARLMLRLAERSSLCFADKTITVSQFLHDYCLETYNKETAMIPNGVEELRNVPADLIKKEFGLEKDGFIVIIGRLIPVKGHLYLLKAFKRIQERTSKKLVIVGGSAFTDDYVNKLYEIAQDDPQIVFTGDLYGRAMEEIYSNAYFVVLPSEMEGLSFVVLESMAHGRAVLGSDIPANLEVLLHHGMTFENKNVDDLEEKLLMLFNYPQLVDDIGRRAKDHILKNYHWRDLVKKTVDVYSSEH